MKKIAVALLVFSFAAVRAQTCVGVFTITVMDSTTKKPLAGKLEKNILYAHSTPEDEFYLNVEEVEPVDSVLKKQKYKINRQKTGYDFFPNKEIPAKLTFPTHCGLYLVQTAFIQKKDTMNLAFYNIPAHQSFQIDSVFFKPGDFYIDLQSSVDDYKWDEKGFYSIPHSFIIPFPKKEDE